jgi:hypothetical protein
MTRNRIAVSIEAAEKKAFATAVDWPGWSRSGKTEELAVHALADYADRYSPVAKLAGQEFPKTDNLDFEVVERQGGGGGTEFGVPSNVTDQDRRRTSAKDADRLARVVEAAWRTFETVAAAAPEELRKGPRGGGRNTSKMVAHVVEADEAYAREMGIKLKAPIEEIRAAMLEVLREPSDGSPIADRKWTPRYAAHRIAWHALDHAWEIEDRSEPAG